MMLRLIFHLALYNRIYQHLLNRTQDLLNLFAQLSVNRTLAKMRRLMKKKDATLDKDATFDKD